MGSFNIVIFGFTGNLSQLKIIPALYDLETKGLLSENTKIVGIGRKEINLQKFVKEIISTPHVHHEHTLDSAIFSRLLRKITYIAQDFEKSPEVLFTGLKQFEGNTLFYLATYPDLYAPILKNLEKFGLNMNKVGWTKILIEKPFGSDYKSARKLNILLAKYFPEKYIFRIDHYLAKESLRKIYNQKIDPGLIKRLEIIASENAGIGKRGVYYNATGALKDMGQNHLLQMLSGVLSSSSERRDRAKAISGLIPVPASLVRGQYKGYLKEENIPEKSDTETFFVLKSFSNNKKWNDIPIYMTSGKMLQRKEEKIMVYLKNGDIKTLWIYPSKTDDFDAYERVIMEAASGKDKYFNSRAEIEAEWKFIDVYKQNIKPVFIYNPGQALTVNISDKYNI